MLDSHGRGIDYLRVSLTDRCNLRCVYCMPEKGILKRTHDDTMRFEETFKVIKACSSLGIKKVRFTGGEPLILKDIDGLIYKTSKLPSIEDISITTNGIFLDEMAVDLKRAGLKRVNISLDTLKEDKYKEITRGGSLKKVLAAIEKCIEIGMTPVKINIVLMKGINDSEIEDFINLTKSMPVNIRFIELMPIGEGARLKDSMMGLDEVIEMHPNLIPISDKSSTAEVFRLEGSKGTVGFIRPLSCKFCTDCNRIRLTSSGTIKPCLHSESEIEVRKYVDNEVKLISVIKDAIFNKPGEHHLENGEKSKSKRMMYQIGG